MNTSLRGMIWDYVPGTNGHTSIGKKTLTTSGAGFLSETGWASLRPWGFGWLPRFLLCVSLYPCSDILILVLLFTISLLLSCISFRVCVICLQNINLYILIVRIALPVCFWRSWTFSDDPGFHVPRLCSVCIPYHLSTVMICFLLCFLLFGNCIWTIVWESQMSYLVSFVFCSQHFYFLFFFQLIYGCSFLFGILRP